MLLNYKVYKTKKTSIQFKVSEAERKYYKFLKIQSSNLGLCLDYSTKKQLKNFV